MNAHDGVLPWKKALGEKIREARENANLTQEALAMAVGLKHRNMIGRYEAGRDAPSFEFLTKIALKLGMTEISVNGHVFSVKPRAEGEAPTPPKQLSLEFDKEYVFSEATLKITSTRERVTVTATVPAPPLSARYSSKERAS